MNQEKIVNSTTELLNLLEQMSPGTSKSTLRTWLKHGRISVDGTTVKIAKTLIQKGQTVRIHSREQKIGPLRIVFEDKHLVVVDKPAGLLSVATEKEKDRTVHNYLKKYYGYHRTHVIHRLDRETSGLLLFAKTDAVKQKLKKLLENHEIAREYDAIVEGTVSEKKGTWKSYLVEDANFFVASTKNKSRGKEAITHWKVVSAAEAYTHLHLNLETGRKNQIRVHCQEAGHPIAGDKKYGATSDPAQRLCLHASTLTFVHPVLNKRMHFDSPLPAPFFSILQKPPS